MIPLVPLQGGHGPHGWEESSSSMAPIIGGFVLLMILALVLGAFYLWRRGNLTLPGLGRPQSPEDEARRILAERFARGDIGSDEFMDRASILNWTPGNDTLPPGPRKRRGRTG